MPAVISDNSFKTFIAARRGFIRKCFNYIRGKPLGSAFYHKRIHTVITAADYPAKAARTKLQVLIKAIG
jgi:hypothetical protein